MIILSADHPFDDADPRRPEPLPRPISELAHRSDMAPACPWCGAPERPRGRHPGAEGRADCATCGRPYLWACRVAVDYLTARIRQ